MSSVCEYRKLDGSGTGKTLKKMLVRFFFVVNVVVMCSLLLLSVIYSECMTIKEYSCLYVYVMANHKTIIVHLFSTNIIIIKRKKKKRGNKRKFLCNGDDADKRNDR